MSERSRAALIWKVESHISDRFCAILWCSVNTCSARRRSKKGPYDPTTATSMETSLENSLRILLNFFAIISIRPVTYKKGILVGAEERGPLPRSDRDGRIYRLGVPVLK